MKKLIILSAAALMILSCKKEKTQESVTQENSAPTIEQTTPEVTTITPEASDAVSNNLELSGTDEMKYDKTQLKAKAGEPIKVTLKHTGKMPKEAMGHNFVLLKPGTDSGKVAADAMNAKDNDYIPADHTDDIIAHTKLLGGGESDTITIDALEPGTYVYICTFPGHVANMKGELIVE